MTALPLPDLHSSLECKIGTFGWGGTNDWVILLQTRHSQPILYNFARPRPWKGQGGRRWHSPPPSVQFAWLTPARLISCWGGITAQRGFTSPMSKLLWHAAGAWSVLASHQKRDTGCKRLRIVIGEHWVVGNVHKIHLRHATCIAVEPALKCSFQVISYML